ncbi:hypothetical protein D3C79_1020440 [compost metagenome]
MCKNGEYGYLQQRLRANDIFDHGEGHAGLLPHRSAWLFKHESKQHADAGEDSTEPERCMLIQSFRQPAA